MTDQQNAKSAPAPMTPVPDFVAGARALLASSDCTINGEPAVVVRVAELNDLVARVHQAEAAAPPDPAAAILAVVETAIGDQLTDGARAEALDGIRRVLGQAVDPADDEAAPCKACGEPWHKRHTCGGRPAGEGLRGLLEHVGIDLTGKTVTVADGPTIAQMHADNARTTPDNPAVAAPATADDGLRATPAEAAVNRVRSWIAGEPVTARSGFGDGYREALRDVLDVIDRKGVDRA